MHPRSRSIGSASRSSVRAATRIAGVSAVASGSVRDRVTRARSSNRSRSVTVRHARFALRMRRPTRSTSPTSTASSSASERCRGRQPERVLRPDRAPPRPGLHPPRVAVVRERVQLAPGRPAEHLHERRLVQRGDLRHPPDPVRVQLARRRRPDAPEPLDGQRVEELQLLAGRDLEQPVRLADRARDLGEELRRRDPDGDRQPDLLAHPRAQPLGDLAAACPRCAPSRARRGTPRRATAPRPRARCRGRSRRRPCSPRSRPPTARGPRSRRGTGASPPRCPSGTTRRRPWPRSSRRARVPGRRAPACRAARGRRAAPRRRRTSRGRHAGWWPLPVALARTHVRIERRTDGPVAPRPQVRLRA